MNTNFAQRAKAIVAKHGNNKKAAIAELDALRREQFEHEQRQNPEPQNAPQLNMQGMNNGTARQGMPSDQSQMSNGGQITMNRELKNGIKVEKEHAPTLDFIRDYMDKNGRLPSQTKLAKSIAVDHIKDYKEDHPNSNGSYYKGLIDNDLSDEAKEYKAIGGLVHPTNVSNQQLETIRRMEMGGRIDANYPQTMYDSLSYIDSARSNHINNHDLGGTINARYVAPNNQYMTGGSIDGLQVGPDNRYALGGSVPTMQLDSNVHYGSGGSIHIKPENRGKFTAYKERTGKTTAEALHSPDPHVRQMANFARNAAKWKHDLGGDIEFDQPDGQTNQYAVGGLLVPNTLYNQGRVEYFPQKQQINSNPYLNNGYANGGKMYDVGGDKPLEDPSVINTRAILPSSSELLDRFGNAYPTVKSVLSTPIGSTSASPWGAAKMITPMIGSAYDYVTGNTADNEGSAMAAMLPGINAEKSFLPGIWSNAERLKYVAPKIAPNPSVIAANKAATFATKYNTLLDKLSSVKSPIDVAAERAAGIPMAAEDVAKSRSYLAAEKRIAKNRALLQPETTASSVAPDATSMGTADTAIADAASVESAPKPIINPDKLTRSDKISAGLLGAGLLGAGIAGSRLKNSDKKYTNQSASNVDFSSLPQVSSANLGINDYSSRMSSSNANNSPDEFNSFVSAMGGQESGGDYNETNKRTGAAGKYQIMPNNWDQWSSEAGLPKGSSMTPDNQEKVARYKLKQYYDKYGPENAAKAWYAGEGFNMYNDEALNRKQGKGDEPSINEYAASVLDRMNGKKSNIQKSNVNSIADQQSNLISNPKLVNMASEKYDTNNLPIKSTAELSPNNLAYQSDINRFNIEKNRYASRPSESTAADTSKENLSSANLAAIAASNKQDERLRKMPITTNALLGLTARRGIPMNTNVNYPTISPSVLAAQQLSTAPIREQLGSQYGTAVNALSGMSGGSGAAARSGLTGASLVSGRAASEGLSDIYGKNAMLKSDAAKYNVEQANQAQRFNAEQKGKGIDAAMAAQQYNEKQRADRDRYMRSGLAASATGLGEIGKENIQRKTLENIYGYDSQGRKIMHTDSPARKSEVDSKNTKSILARLFTKNKYNKA